MNFFKQTLASLIGTLTGLFLFVTLGASGLVIMLMAFTSVDRSPTVKDKSILVFDLSIQIQDTEPPITLRDILSDEDKSIISLRNVIQNIEKASQDDRIVGIFIDGSEGSGVNGYATLTEIREALTKFKKTGKKIIAYDESFSEPEYYLNSVADTLILNPMGSIEMNGLGTQPLFWTKALEKYGIGVQVVRVGNYKSAVEPFIRENLSTENREQLQVLFDNIWGNFLTTVGKSRQLSPQNLQEIADNKGFLNAQEAQKMKLIDEVAYRDQVLTKLKNLTDSKEDSFSQISLANYSDVSVLAVPKKSSNNKIAVVYLDGTIVDGQGTREEVGASRFTRLLRRIRQDEKVKAVVIRINSPGGSATASDIILREIQLIRDQKPVIISMGNVAASGGYWIATGGQHIFAESNTITGSIGVFGMLFNIQEIANNNGITWDSVKTAKLADLGTATRPKTAQELAIYQTYVNQIYDLFLSKVSQSRHLPKAKVAAIAQG
ncbi:signal peptide peptidase SppA, partial [Aphanothece sacrum]